MFRFEHPQFFWLLAIPVLWAVLSYTRKRLLAATWLKWGSVHSNEKATFGTQVKPVHTWMGLVGISLLSISAVNPQWGFKKSAVQTKSAELFIALDISNSMLAEDIAPNRLERAKRMALDLSSAFKTDKVGLIVFAGNAYIQSPLTTDWHAIQLYLNAANPDQAGTQGTAIGDAIRLALNARKKDDAEESNGAIIILTDGEDHDSDAVSAIAEANGQGWTTYLIGVGTEAGATIPMMVNGNKELKRDENGQPVNTKLNEALMKDLAEKGHGRYFNISEGATVLNELQKELANLSRTQLEKRAFSEHKSYFQWFLLPGLLLLFGYVGLNYRFDVM